MEIRRGSEADAEALTALYDHYTRAMPITFDLEPWSSEQRMRWMEGFASGRGVDVHRAIAGVTLPNAASVALHQRFGFRLAGTMSAVGRKFGRYWDVAWYEKSLGA